jgi:hypothetical protein
VSSRPCGSVASSRHANVDGVRLGCRGDLRARTGGAEETVATSERLSFNAACSATAFAQHAATLEVAAAGLARAERQALITLLKKLAQALASQGKRDEAESVYQQ